MLKQRIADDLKQAMLSGDKQKAELLGMLKSAILYKEVELGVRETGLDDNQIIDVFTKEAKKRQEAAELYAKAGDEERAQKERSEKEVINTYLPEQASEADIVIAVEEAISNLRPNGLQDMGKVIGAVKSKLGARADGGVIAKIVKEKLQ